MPPQPWPRRSRLPDFTYDPDRPRVEDVPLADLEPGRFTMWGGFNQNGKTVNGTFTFSLRGTGADGSTVRVNLVEHFNARPDGTVNEFFHCH